MSMTSFVYSKWLIRVARLALSKLVAGDFFLGVEEASSGEVREMTLAEIAPKLLYEF